MVFSGKSIVSLFLLAAFTSTYCDVGIVYALLSANDRDWTCCGMSTCCCIEQVEDAENCGVSQPAPASCTLKQARCDGQPSLTASVSPKILHIAPTHEVFYLPNGSLDYERLNGEPPVSHLDHSFFHPPEDLVHSLSTTVL